MGSPNRTLGRKFPPRIGLGHSRTIGRRVLQHPNYRVTDAPFTSKHAISRQIFRNKKVVSLKLARWLCVYLLVTVVAHIHRFMYNECVPSRGPTLRIHPYDPNLFHLRGKVISDIPVMLQARTSCLGIVLVAVLCRGLFFVVVPGAVPLPAFLSSSLLLS